jgi:hypothetical protein
MISFPTANSLAKQPLYLGTLSGMSHRLQGFQPGRGQPASHAN